MIPFELRFYSHIAPFLFLFLIFFLLTRSPMATAQEVSGDFFSDSTFERSGEISGTVIVDGRLPASDVTITIRSISLGTVRSILPEPDGHFRVSGLPRGAYQVVAEAQGYFPSQAVAQVERLPADVSLRLKPAHPAFSSANGAAVSVRDLKIPPKARNEYEKGIASLVKQDPAASVPHLNRATQLFPGYYEAYYHLGVAEVRLHHDAEALEDFQKAIDLSGGHFAVAQFAYGLLLSDRGEPEQGERIIRAGLETNPDAADGHFFLSIALCAQNRLEEAEKSVREALLRKPNLADAYLILSDIHAKRNDYAAQIRDLDTFLKLAPNAPQAAKIRQIRELVQRLADQPGTTAHIGATPPSAVSD